MISPCSLLCLWLLLMSSHILFCNQMSWQLARSKRQLFAVIELPLFLSWRGAKPGLEHTSNIQINFSRLNNKIMTEKKNPRSFDLSSFTSHLYLSPSSSMLAGKDAKSNDSYLFRLKASLPFPSLHSSFLLLCVARTIVSPERFERELQLLCLSLFCANSTSAPGELQHCNIGSPR